MTQITLAAREELRQGSTEDFMPSHELAEASGYLVGQLPGILAKSRDRRLQVLIEPISNFIHTLY
jgi:hypothetical protein